MNTLLQDGAIRRSLMLLLGGVLMLSLFGCGAANAKKAAVLTFDSFDGGGPEYTVAVQDPAVVRCKTERRYKKANHEKLDGAGYSVILTFAGLQPGETQVLVSARSPIGGSFDARYRAQVDDTLRVSLTELSRTDPFEDAEEEVYEPEP